MYFFIQLFTGCRALEVDDNALLYHILVLLKNKTERHFDVVIDCTHADNENRFKVSLTMASYDSDYSVLLHLQPDTLQRLLTSIPDSIVNGLNACYVINCNSFVRKYVAQYQRLLTPLKVVWL